MGLTHAGVGLVGGAVFMASWGADVVGALIVAMGTGMKQRYALRRSLAAWWTLFIRLSVLGVICPSPLSATLPDPSAAPLLISQGSELESWIEQARTGTPEARMQALWKLHANTDNARLREPQVVNMLLEGLRHDHPGVRGASAAVLGKLQEPRAVAPLIQTLQDSEPIVRMRAAETLGQIGDRRATGPLIDRLADHDRNVRSSVVGALGDLHDPQAVAPLIPLMHDPYPEIRMLAVSVLGAIGDRRATEPLLEIVRDADKGDLRGFAIVALGRLDDRRATPVLIERLQDPNPEIRHAAARVLSRFKDPRAAVPLFDALMKDPALPVSEAIKGLKNKHDALRLQEQWVKEEPTLEDVPQKPEAPR